MDLPIHLQIVYVKDMLLTIIVFESTIDKPRTWETSRYFGEKKPSQNDLRDLWASSGIFMSIRSCCPTYPTTASFVITEGFDAIIRCWNCIFFAKIRFTRSYGEALNINSSWKCNCFFQPKSRMFYCVFKQINVSGFWQIPWSQLTVTMIRKVVSISKCNNCKNLRTRCCLACFSTGLLSIYLLWNSISSDPSIPHFCRSHYPFVLL